MTRSLADELHTVLITGATDGLGRATAILLAQEGFQVFAAGRNPQKRAALEQFAEEHKLPLETIELDVTSDASAVGAVAEIERRAAGIDVLINNAGIAIVAPVEEIALEDLRRQFETNFIAAVRMAQCVLPGMRERRRGRIVNMSSIAAKVSNPLMGAYSASKGALEAISDAMRLELAQFGIPVVLIEPGFIPTNMGQASAALSSRYVQNASASPYGRTYAGFLQMWKKVVHRARSRPEDCARVILNAIRAESPRTRYLVTSEAKVSNAMRRLLPDRYMDRLTLRMLGMGNESEAPMPSVESQVEELVRPQS